MLDRHGNPWRLRGIINGYGGPSEPDPGPEGEIRVRQLKLAAGMLAAFLGALCPGAANAQYFGQNKVQYREYDWRSIESDHFEVYFYTGEDSLAMRTLDLAEKTQTMLAQRMGHTLSRRVPIILYGSHNDFSQTNVTPELIDAGTGGFTEVLRNRVVLPFTGPYEDLRHVVVHELTHAVMFDYLYGGSAASLIARQSFYSVPTWFAEGLAEYFSLGIEPNAEMFLRDGIVEGYLPPLALSSGYIVYKQGQSALSYLVDRYGEDRLRDILRRIRQNRSFDRAFQASVGMPVGKFDEQWRTWLRKRYWPTVAHKDTPEEFARRLTDHRHDQSTLNTAPAISPQGDRIAYFSDRRQYTDVYVMSAFDGKVLHRVIRGERSYQYETIPSFRSSITWSPDGERLALTAKSGGSDVLYVVSARDGKTLHRFKLPCDALYFPAWAPHGDSIAVAGVKDGRSDLWLVDGSTGTFTRLTNDAYDEKEPAWSPDGRTLTFASDRLAPVVLEPTRSRDGFGRYAIYGLDLATGAVTLTVDTYGNDHAPAWSPDGRRLAFVSDRDGTSNIYLYDVAERAYVQLTDVMGGVQTISWSRENDRLVFAAYNGGGFDVFAVKEPLSLDSAFDRLRKQFPAAVLDSVTALVPPGDTLRVEPRRAALKRMLPDSLTLGAQDSTLAGGPATLPDPKGLDLAHHTAPADPGAHADPPAGLGNLPAPPETTAAIVAKIPLVERGGPFALPDSVLAQKPTPYHARLAPDYAGGGFYAASGFGFVGSTQFVFSDFLGDHSLYVATDLFSNSLEETNALAIYNYLRRRLDLGIGLFHFKDYFSSRVTTLGEQLDSPRLFSEQTFGGILSASYPFDRFRRAELNLTQMFVDRRFFDQNAAGDFYQTASQFRSVTSPSLSLIGDNALFGYYGPVNGQRWNLTYSPSFALFKNGLEYHTVTLDARRYWDLTRGYTLAGRVLAGASNGRDAQTFRVGGYSTLRGYSDFDLLGSRVAILNTELRFPFIQELGILGPIPVGVFNLRGAVFTDAGFVWNEGDRLRLTHVSDGRRRLDDLKLGFGAGIRTAIYFLILKVDTGWNTDFAGASRPRWHVSVGPEF